MKPHIRKKVAARKISSSTSSSQHSEDSTHGLAEEVMRTEKTWETGELVPVGVPTSYPFSAAFCSLWSLHQSSAYPLSKFVGACSDISTAAFWWDRWITPSVQQGQTEESATSNVTSQRIYFIITRCELPSSVFLCSHLRCSLLFPSLHLRCFLFSRCTFLGLCILLQL